jgi:hypothetical protein
MFVLFLNGQRVWGFKNLKDPHVVEHLFHLHDKYVVVPADKAFKF